MFIELLRHQPVAGSGEEEDRNSAKGQREPDDNWYGMSRAQRPSSRRAASTARGVGLRLGGLGVVGRLVGLCGSWRLSPAAALPQPEQRSHEHATQAEGEEQSPRKQDWRSVPLPNVGTRLGPMNVPHDNRIGGQDHAKEAEEAKGHLQHGLRSRGAALCAPRPRAQEGPGEQERQGEGQQNGTQGGACAAQVPRVPPEVPVVAVACPNQPPRYRELHWPVPSAAEVLAVAEASDHHQQRRVGGEDGVACTLSRRWPVGQDVPTDQVASSPHDLVEASVAHFVPKLHGDDPRVAAEALRHGRQGLDPLRLRVVVGEPHPVERVRLAAPRRVRAVVVHHHHEAGAGDGRHGRVVRLQARQVPASPQRICAQGMRRHGRVREEEL
mmetsp:Transcript_6242/g.16709  ORF Transcript_6242/g.16709 Transcript_6242/m.16709 type:complete len:383 (-) Transcript_6242:86-1234(-)